MADFNTLSPPQPFGTSTATISPQIGAQFFMGCSVIDFNVSADWSSQGGSLTVNILEDTLDSSKVDYLPASGIWVKGSTYTQKVQDTTIYDWATGSYGSLPVIGSPQPFRIIDTSNNVSFQYDGILDSISRNVTPQGGKVFTVNLSSPLKLLENCSVLMSSFPGFGHPKEGSPTYLSQNQFYKLVTNATSSYAPLYFDTFVLTYRTETLKDDLNKAFFNFGTSIELNEIYTDAMGNNPVVNDSTEAVGIAFGTHNRNVNWQDVYNVQNIFGIFENENYGLDGYGRFGASRSNYGMRLDMIAYALNELINRNPAGVPLPGKRYFGGNIISGTSTYNFYQVATGGAFSNPYFYGFDVYSFFNPIMDSLGKGYIYKGSVSSNLLEMISSLASDAGIDFVIELNRIQTSDAAEDNYWDGFHTVSNYDCPGSLYDGGTFHLEKSNTNSLPGGIVSVKLLDRRTLSVNDPANVKNPFSKIAFGILGYEVPDYGDKNLGSALINPGDTSLNSFDSSFETGVFGVSYMDPLDNDLVGRGTDGSTPYGGRFPVVTLADQNQSADVNNLDITNTNTDVTSTQIVIRDNQQTTAKFLIGGFQSRISHVPIEHIYQYWGEVKINSNEDICQAALDTQIRSIPVITPILEEDDSVDFIMIDVQHISPSGGNNNHLQNVFFDGIYPASVAEIRAAMSSKTNWLDYVYAFKPCAIFSIGRAYGLDLDAAQRLIIGALWEVTQPSGTAQTSINTTATPQGKEAANFNKIMDVSPPPSKPSRMGSPPKKESVTRNQLVQADIFKTIDALHNAIKKIGDEHYGKSWVAWSPQITTKVTENIQNFGEFERSWLPSDSAYLEPGMYDDLHAPQHNKFLDGGRLKGYANFYSGFDDADDYNSKKPLDPGTFSFDFSEISEDSKFQSNFCDGSRVHLKIDVDKEYTFVPYDYFYYYDRGRRPLVKSGEVYDITYTDTEYPFLVRETGYEIYSGDNKGHQDQSVNSMNTYTKLPVSITYTSNIVVNPTGELNQLLCNDSTNTTFAPSGGISNTTLVTDFTELIVPDHGVNCITFTKFKTGRVLPPKHNNSGQPNLDLAIGLLAESYRDSVSISGVTSTTSTIPGIAQNTTLYAKVAVPPLEVGIPQQSNRHRYGPWFTSHNFIYGGKVEVIEDNELVPENFISPLYGTLSEGDPNSPVFAEELSGFAGMNNAGSGIANAIDGYGQFVAEDGNITIPGGPLIQRIGDALLTGPYITELSVKVGAQGIETNYSFNSATKKAGKTNADIVKKLRDFSTKVTGK